MFAGGDSGSIRRELLEKGHAAAVLPYDPVTDSVVLIEQFRIGAIADRQSPWLIELIAGFMEPDEESEDVIRREAMEEAGCSFNEPQLISQYYVSPGSTPEMISLFCARIDSRGVGGIYGLKTEGEDIRVKVTAAQEAFSLVDNGVVRAATPIIALQWLKLNHERLKQQWL